MLDNLRDIRVAAFDKTGTLTEGVFEVNAILPMPGVSREELLSVAALAESRSNHPIARSVLRAALAAGLGTEKDAAVSAMREIPGKGVEVTADGAQVLAGNAALLEAYNITPLPVDMPGSVVQVARDGRALGALVVSDRIKPQAPGALEALRRLGVDVLAMLTGDRQSQARPVAKELGLDVLKADLLPEDKASALEALGPTRQTLMVGDGINDAPVLATAGVGVAMGGLGSEAAIETADVVILDDNPLRLRNCCVSPGVPGALSGKTSSWPWASRVCSWDWALWAFPACGKRSSRMWAWLCWPCSTLPAPGGSERGHGRDGLRGKGRGFWSPPFLHIRPHIRLPAEAAPAGPRRSVISAISEGTSTRRGKPFQSPAPELTYRGMPSTRYQPRTYP